MNKISSEDAMSLMEKYLQDKNENRWTHIFVLYSILIASNFCWFIYNIHLYQWKDLKEETVAPKTNCEKRLENCIIWRDMCLSK